MIHRRIHVRQLHASWRVPVCVLVLIIASLGSVLRPAPALADVPQPRESPAPMGNVSQTGAPADMQPLPSLDSLRETISAPQTAPRTYSTPGARTLPAPQTLPAAQDPVPPAEEDQGLSWIGRILNPGNWVMDAVLGGISGVLSTVNEILYYCMLFLTGGDPNEASTGSGGVGCVRFIFCTNIDLFFGEGAESLTVSQGAIVHNPMSSVLVTLWTAMQTIGASLLGFLALVRIGRIVAQGGGNTAAEVRELMKSFILAVFMVLATAPMLRLIFIIFNLVNRSIIYAVVGEGRVPIPGWYQLSETTDLSLGRTIVVMIFLILSLFILAIGYYRHINLFILMGPAPAMGSLLVEHSTRPFYRTWLMMIIEVPIAQLVWVLAFSFGTLLMQTVQALFPASIQSSLPEGVLPLLELVQGVIVLIIAVVAGNKYSKIAQTQPGNWQQLARDGWDLWQQRSINRLNRQHAGGGAPAAGGAPATDGSGAVDGAPTGNGGWDPAAVAGAAAVGAAVGAAMGGMAGAAAGNNAHWWNNPFGGGGRQPAGAGAGAAGGNPNPFGGAGFGSPGGNAGRDPYIQVINPNAARTPGSAVGVLPHPARGALEDGGGRGPHGMGGLPGLPDNGPRPQNPNGSPPRLALPDNGSAANGTAGDGRVAQPGASRPRENGTNGTTDTNDTSVNGTSPVNGTNTGYQSDGGVLVTPPPASWTDTALRTANQAAHIIDVSSQESPQESPQEPPHTFDRAGVPPLAVMPRDAVVFDDTDDTDESPSTVEGDRRG